MIKGGHYDISTLKTTTCELIDDCDEPNSNATADVYTIICIASMKNKEYSVRIFFADSKYCPDGDNSDCFLCSHQAGLVTLLYMISKRNDIVNLESFEAILPENVLHIISQSIPLVFYKCY